LPREWSGIDVVRIEGGVVVERWTSASFAAVAAVAPPSRLWCGAGCVALAVRMAARAAEPIRYLPVREPAAMLVERGAVQVRGDGLTTVAAGGATALVPVGELRRVEAGEAVVFPRGGSALVVPPGTEAVLILVALVPEKDDGGQEREDRDRGAGTDWLQALAHGEGRAAVNGLEVTLQGMAPVQAAHEEPVELRVDRLWLPRGHAAIFAETALTWVERGCATLSRPGTPPAEQSAWAGDAGIDASGSTISSCAEDGLTVILAVSFRRAPSLPQ
jgi:hypothetical protein